MIFFMTENMFDVQLNYITIVTGRKIVSFLYFSDKKSSKYPAKCVFKINQTNWVSAKVRAETQ